MSGSGGAPSPGPKAGTGWASCLDADESLFWEGRPTGRLLVFQTIDLHLCPGTEGDLIFGPRASLSEAQVVAYGGSDGSFTFCRIRGVDRGHSLARAVQRGDPPRHPLR